MKKRNKKHWVERLPSLACGGIARPGSAKDTCGLLWVHCGASVYCDLATADPDWYCVTCATKARLALAAESKPQPTVVPFAPRHCARCRSGAINPSDHGRTEGVDLDLCDVCYWRKRAFDPRPMSEAREDEILGYCPGIGWRRLSRVAWRRWGLTGAEHIADYEPTHFLPLPPEVM